MAEEIEREQLKTLLREAGPDKQDAILTRLKERGVNVIESAPITAPMEAGLEPQTPLNLMATLGKSLEYGSGVMAEELGKIGVKPPIAAAVGMVPAVAADIIGKSPIESALSLATLGLGTGLKSAGEGVTMMAHGIKPEILNIVKEAESLGIHLTPAEMTQGGFLSSIEASLSKFPFSSEAMRFFRGERMSKLAEARDALIGSFGKK